MSSIHKDGHRSRFADQQLKKMQLLRVSEQYCDVRIMIAETQQSVLAHRLVLGASSDYLRALSANQTDRNLELRVTNVDGDILEMLISSCYTGVVALNWQNIENVYDTALKLKMTEVLKACKNFLHCRILDSGTWLKVLELAERVKLEALREDALCYAIRNFATIAASVQFLTISAEHLTAIIESKEFNGTGAHEAIYAIKHWYEHDKDGRGGYMARFVAALNITQLEPSFIMEHVRTLPGCAALAMDAIERVVVVRKRQHTRSMPKSASVRRSWSQAYDTRGARSRFSAINQEYGALLAIPISLVSKKSILQYDCKRSEWKEIAQLGLKRNFFSVAYTKKSQLIFIGGRFDEDNMASNDVDSYSLLTGQWQKLASMRIRRYRMCVAQLGAHIYVFGGRNESGLIHRSVERFNVETGEWGEVSSMRHFRYGATAVVHRNLIYIMGGLSHGNIYLDSTECYNPQTDKWQQLADMHEARYLHGATLAHDKIYIMGGWNDEGLVLRTVECYDPQKNIWTQICSLNLACHKANGVYFNNRLMALGGWCSSIVEEYDFERNVWIKQKSLPSRKEFNYVTLPICFAEKLKGNIISDVEESNERDNEQ